MPLGDAVETFIRREDAERFIEEVRSDDPGLASYVRIEERELEAGGEAVATIVDRGFHSDYLSARVGPGHVPARPTRQPPRRSSRCPTWPPTRHTRTGSCCCGTVV
jgi:hypothetical protein